MSHLFNSRLKAVCTLFLLTVLLVAGCAPFQPTPVPVTIRFAHLDADKAYYERLAAKFQKDHPGVTVQLVGTTWTGLANLGPKDADVAITQQALLRRERGDIIDLNSFLAGDNDFNKADYFPGLFDLFTYQGKTVAIPRCADPEVMFYNKDLFDERHVAYPKVGWTWDDFRNTAIALSEPDKGTYGYVFDAGSGEFQEFVLQHGGTLFDDPLRPTRATFTDPKTVEAVEWYAALIHKLHVAPTPAEAIRLYGEQYTSYYAIQGGRCGMFMFTLGTAGGRSWYQPWSFKWGVTTLPRDELAVNGVRTDALVISSAAPRPEVCWQWISFISHELPNVYGPARRSLAESAAFDKAVGTDSAKVFRAAMEHPVYDLSGGGTEFSKRAYAALGKARIAIISGEKPAAQALAEAQAEAGNQ